ncbi:phage tail tape measure protein [Buttiauxella noackiae]|uniref:phage tail tape measure protein n=1 Tax=Buttiauxella noackiae TaxID=82992 RepID=UPI000551D152|nr:phage tail tape measure protein [Buttiauxella noackiae]
MNDRNLRLQVVMSAIDKLTRPFKQARASTQELAASVKKSRDALTQLSQTTAKLDGFKKLQAENQKLGDRLNYARQKASLMNQEIGASGPPSQRQILALEKQRLAVQRLEERQGKLQSRTAQVRAELYRAGISANDGASATARITRETERYNRQLSEQEIRLRRTGEQQRKLAAARATFDKTRALRNELAGNGAGMVATGVATAMPLLAPVKAYSESEDAATQLAASMMGSGGKVLPEFEKINRLALQLGDRLPGTTADFQNMMTMLRRQGMSATAILGGLGEATAYLGVQLRMPATEAAEFAAKLQDATGTAEKDMMSLMDVIQKGFYAGVDPNNMLNGYAKISSAMDIIKMKGVDAAKALAPLLIIADQSGMEGGSAGNAYRKVFQSTLDVKNVSGVNDELKAKSTGIHLDFTNGKGSFGGIENMYKQLAKINKLDDVMKQSVIKDLFGDDGETLQVIQKMISTGIDGYREVEAKLQAQASLRERVDSQLKTLGNRWEAASGSFTNSLAAIGGTVAPQLKQMADWLGELANRLGEFVKKHPQLTSVLFKTIAAFALVATAGGVLALAISGILGPFALASFSVSKLGAGLPALTRGFTLLSDSFKLVGKGLLAMGRAALANPILLVIAVIAAAAFYVWKHWDTLGPKFKALWKTVSDGAEYAWAWIKLTAGAAWDWIKQAVASAWEFIKNIFMDYTLPGLIYKNWDAIKSGVSEAWTGIQNYISQKWNDIIADATALSERFKTAGSEMIDGLLNGISEKWDSLKSKLASLTDLIPDWLKSDAKTPAFNLYNTQPAKQGLNPYAGAYDIGGNIPHGQFGIVGENGPELVNGPANITSRRRTAALAAATALAFGSLSQPVAAKPLHPYSLPKSEYQNAQQPSISTSHQTASIGKVEIHIHQQPGQSPADVADEVMRRIEAKQRQLAARTRSSFRDQDMDF